MVWSRERSGGGRVFGGGGITFGEGDLLVSWFVESDAPFFEGRACSTSPFPCSGLSRGTSSGTKGSLTDALSFVNCPSCGEASSSFCDDGIKSGTGMPGIGKPL